MGLLDVLTGKRKLREPAPERLFALSTAAVTLEAQYAITSSGRAAIVFQALDTADFAELVSDMEEVVRGTGEDSGTSVSAREDSFGYRWMVLSGGEIDDLVVGVHAVSGALVAGGYGDRVLCAVFALSDARHGPLYVIYNYKRGSFYPFVPIPGGAHERDSERELKLKAQLGGEMSVEPELERWFPLWDAPI